jgi:hypothetical protein
MLHPGVNAAGKKYSTTGPFLSAVFRSKVIGLPACAPLATNVGAVAPLGSEAKAGAAASPS